MRRLISAFCLLLASALPCQAQGEKPKPNTLTPKEIADGWILLFDGETTFGWQSEGKLTIEKDPGSAGRPGVFLRLGSLDKPKEELARTSVAFQEFDLQFDYEGFAIVYLKPANAAAHDKKGDRFVLPLSHRWTTAQFRITSQTYGGKTETVNDGLVEFPEKDRVSPNAPVNIVFESKHISIANIKLRPLNTKSLFNGKDLAGWKEFPGKKSTFTVEGGAIHVKNGPGDLQTVGKYKDFVLQLEAISNGKHLNSGIFFRCKDNEYQNGYEAQIFNKFSKDATQKYLVEEYDPKTNKLLAKKEVMSTAFDYGTGAIYRRVPARKEMSKDGEWFGMTIVAHGNHLATWVNGVQVTDWTDNRPKSDNARTGCKLEAGHISIQGHDPTTDLSFKNFRIAEFK